MFIQTKDHDSCSNIFFISSTHVDNNFFVINFSNTKTILFYNKAFLNINSFFDKSFDYFFRWAEGR